MTEPLYLVDASIYIFRSYYSMPDTFTSKSGESVNAVYGYTNFLLDLCDKNPKYISVAFDESLNTCYRNEIYPDYKANRDLPDPNLTYQLAQCQEVTRLMGFHALSMKHFEADDIIGTLHAKLAGDRPAIIVTRDKDLGQLLGPRDVLWDFAANDFASPEDVQVKFGVSPSQIADFLALAGDSVDNIPGAPGIGAKSAAGLLTHFGDIDGIFANVDGVLETGLRGAKKMRETLIEHEANIRMYQSITRIKCDIDIDVSLEDVKAPVGDVKGLADFSEQMNFGARVRKRLADMADPNGPA